jgi:hypothetical protein
MNKHPPSEPMSPRVLEAALRALGVVTDCTVVFLAPR